MTTQTISEKILSAHCGHPVRAGEIAVGRVDCVIGTDGSGPMAIDYFEQMGGRSLFDPSRVFFSLDHYAPPDTPQTMAFHQRIREFAAGAAHVERPVDSRNQRNPGRGIRTKVDGIQHNQSRHQRTAGDVGGRGDDPGRHHTLQLNGPPFASDDGARRPSRANRGPISVDGGVSSKSTATSTSLPGRAVPRVSCT